MGKETQPKSLRPGEIHLPGGIKGQPRELLRRDPLVLNAANTVLTSHYLELFGNGQEVQDLGDEFSRAGHALSTERLRNHGLTTGANLLIRAAQIHERNQSNGTNNGSNGSHA